MKKTASKKTNTKKSLSRLKYVESHWAIFMLEGIIALCAGAYLLFTGVNNIEDLTAVAGSVLICIAIIEIFNTISRRIRQNNWGIAFAIAVFEAIVGICMVTLRGESHIVHIVLLAGYTLARGIASIVIGFTSFTDKTDRFLWVVCGMVASIAGFIIFADSGLSETIFIKIFGTFLMVFGLTNIFFAIHSNDQLKKLTHKK